MLRYWERVYREGRIAPHQIVLWGGRGRVGVAEGVYAGKMSFAFDVIDPRQLDLSPLVESGSPGEAVVALLGRVDKPRALIRVILNRTRNLPLDESTLARIHDADTIAVSRWIRGAVLANSPDQAFR